MIFEDLTSIQWLEYNAKLQQKKNAIRKLLKERGVLQKKGNNKFDNYKYFSEAQYKELFTGLFADVGIELKASEVDYIPFEGTEKQSNGRIVKVEFTLTDIETGFFEVAYISGEGIDKGDKAGYKAYTGAIKYFLADNFMVATGDDPDKESPSNAMNTLLATDREKKNFKTLCENAGISPEELLKQVGATSWKGLTAEQHGQAMILYKHKVEKDG